ncbi:MAG: serine protease, partial [Clostridia bacterium]|nr:serine protease [Clostridia bacterium]
STRYDDSTGRIERYEEVSVYEISDGSLAKDIFEVGDVIKQVKIGAKAFDINRQFQLIDAMLDARVGDTVTFTVVRDDAEIELSTTITESCLTAY